MNELLVKNQIVLLDAEDYIWASKLEWRIDTGGYVARWVEKKVIFLHREILQKKLGRQLSLDEFTDHKNGNKLDNRRSNLRPATRSQNQANSKRINKSGFRGVKKNDRGTKWRAVIEQNGKKIFVGNFQTASDAAHAYNLKATELFGEFATLNTLSPSDTLESRVSALEKQVEKLTNKGTRYAFFRVKPQIKPQVKLSTVKQLQLTEESA